MNVLCRFKGGLSFAPPPSHRNPPSRDRTLAVEDTGKVAIRCGRWRTTKRGGWVPGAKGRLRYLLWGADFCDLRVYRFPSSGISACQIDRIPPRPALRGLPSPSFPAGPDLPRKFLHFVLDYVKKSYYKCTHGPTPRAAPTDPTRIPQGKR